MSFCPLLDRFNHLGLVFFLCKPLGRNVLIHHEVPTVNVGKHVAVHRGKFSPYKLFGSTQIIIFYLELVQHSGVTVVLGNENLVL